MAYTVSIVLGKGCISHNNRTIKNKDSSERSWDPEKTKLNRVYVDTPIQKKYHELFDDSLKKYNDKQKRDDRKIKNYYEKISRSKQEKCFYELIFSIGDMETLAKGSADERSAKEVLDIYARSFERLNPNFKLFQCTMHNDEKGVPHLHVDFIPVSEGNKRGLNVKNSMRGALSQMGYEKGREGFSQWREAQLDVLKELMYQHNLEYTKSLKPRIHGSLPKEKYIEYEKDLQKIESVKKDLQKIESKKFEIENVNITQQKFLGSRVIVDSDELNQILEQNKSYILNRDKIEQLPKLYQDLDKRIENAKKLELSLNEKQECLDIGEDMYNEKVAEFQKEKESLKSQLQDEISKYQTEYKEAIFLKFEAENKISHAEVIADNNVRMEYEQKIKNQSEQINDLENQIKDMQHQIKEEQCIGFEKGYRAGESKYLSTIERQNEKIASLNLEISKQSSSTQTLQVSLKRKTKELDLANETVKNQDKVIANLKKDMSTKDKIILELKSGLDSALQKMTDVSKAISYMRYDSSFNQTLRPKSKLLLDSIEKVVCNFLESHNRKDLSSDVQEHYSIASDIYKIFSKLYRERNSGIER